MFNDSGEPAINTLVISTSQYGEYDKWQDAGEPAGNAIPKGYGTVIQKVMRVFQRKRRRQFH